jgi:hypothetical protein
MDKTPTYPLYQSLNPCRPPDWRWQRACRLMAMGQYATKGRDDQMTRRTVRFLRTAKRYCTERGFRGLAEREPDLIGALALRLDGEVRQLELRCRVLARQTVGEIARVMNLSPGAVRCYVDLFFAIEDRLLARDYILLQVVGVSCTARPSLESLMQASVYVHGPHMVPAWLDYLVHGDESHDLATPEGRRREAFELFVAAANLLEDDKTDWELVKKSPFVFRTTSRFTETPTVGQLFAASAMASWQTVLPGMPEENVEMPRVANWIAKIDIGALLKRVLALAA